MCLIMDANIVTKILDRKDGSLLPVGDALFAREITAFHGGKLTQEYLKIVRIGRILAELGRIGALKRASSIDVNRETDRFKSLAILSDDPHILGLAFVTGARLLCSNDKNLHSDFTNSNLLAPRGSVYQNSGHKHLLQKHCKKPRKKK